jgi:hypothetical protein
MCNLTYDIEGYQHTRFMATKEGTKLLLPEEHRHPDWVRVSSKTFIHRAFTQQYNVHLHTMHGSFEALAMAHNSIVLDGISQEEGEMS